MRKLNSVFMLLLIFVLAQLAGCQSSPGGIFSPSADLFVSKVEPPFLQPTKAEDSSGSSSSSQVSLTMPALNLSFNVSNGVSCFLSSYLIRYYTTDGKPLNSGKFDHSGAMSLFVNAPEVTWTKSEEEAEDGLSGETAPNATSIEVFLPVVYSFMTKNNALVTDDIVPAVAKIEFYGKDINDRNVSAAAQVNLSTTIKEEEE